jgi:plastocyanin
MIRTAYLQAGRTSLAVLSLSATLAACGGTTPATQAPTANPVAAAPAVATPPVIISGPAGERAVALREASTLLEKAAIALAAGNKYLAEQLFSTAEVLTGRESLATIAPLFREGAPPMVTEPTKKIDVATTAPQPKVLGGSESDDEEDKIAPPKIATGSLKGVVQIDGRPSAGAFGLVTLEPIGRKGAARTPKKRVLEQRGREFLPHVLAVPVGSTIEFPNQDQVFHNVFSTSATTAFDLGLYRGGEAREFTFAKEGILRVGCNLHANMSAYIAVVAAPHFVITDATGAFVFKNLLPGKYKLRAWNERTKTPTVTEITIKAGSNDVSVGVTDDAPSGPQPDKFGAKRG